MYVEFVHCDFCLLSVEYVLYKESGTGSMFLYKESGRIFFIHVCSLFVISCEIIVTCYT